jgi:hypothetical protein
MKTINTEALVTVTGGKSDAVSTQLTALQGSIKDLASAQAKPAGGLSDPTTMMFMMMAMRPQPQQTVVAAPAAAPVINVSTRFGRRW